MKKTVYRIIAVSLMISVLFALSGCEQNTKIPAVLFLERIDDSELYSPGEIEKDTPVYFLGFYDKDGNYYYSDDPEITALDNKTLAAEYEAGNLSQKLISSKSCDAAALAEKYAELKKICVNEKIEMDYPELFPEVRARRTCWYVLYYDKNGDLQYQTIHVNKCTTNIYSKNSKVNDIYEWISETLKNKE